VSTSEAAARRGPTAVALVAGAGGLPRPGVAICHQVTTLDRAKLTERLGTLSAVAIAAVERGLKAALDID
jgi:mRNA-degrading endonuclease toxin of MazEF toxin-antitoxin module